MLFGLFLIYKRVMTNLPICGIALVIQQLMHVLSYLFEHYSAVFCVVSSLIEVLIGFASLSVRI